MLGRITRFYAGKNYIIDTEEHTTGTRVRDIEVHHWYHRTHEPTQASWTVDGSSIEIHIIETCSIALRCTMLLAKPK